MQTENQAGLSFTNLKLKLVELSNSPDGFSVENVDEVYFSEPLNFEKDKETKIFSVLQNAYNELLLNKSADLASVSFALPFEFFHILHVPYDNSLLNEDLIEEFRWEFSVNYPYLNCRDLVIQYYELEKNNFLDYNSAIALGVPRKYINFVFGFCEKNNLMLKFIDNAHFAAERALSLNNRLEQMGLVLSLYLADRFISLMFLFKGKPVHCKFITFTNVAHISQLINKELNSSEFVNGDKNTIEAAFITGDDITESFAEALSQKTEILFNRFNPFQTLPFNEELLKNKHFTENFNSFGAAAGIAYRLA
jgi:Tfp pilus assembly PilM family ATPase